MCKRLPDNATTTGTTAEDDARKTDRPARRQDLAEVCADARALAGSLWDDESASVDAAAEAGQRVPKWLSHPQM